MSSKLLTLFGGQGHFWNELNTGTVFAGGLAQSSWTDSYTLSSVLGWRSFIDLSPIRAIRQTGTITRVTAKLGTQSLIGCKACVWRPLGSGTYRLVSSQSVTPVNGVNTWTVSLDCRVGDRLGVACQDDGNSNAIMTSTSAGDPGCAYKNAEPAGDLGAWSAVATHRLQLECSVDPPAIATVGDSIIRGGNYWTTHTHASGYQIPTLDPADDPAYQIASRLGPGLTSQNHGVGSRTWAGVRSTDAPAALATLPRLIYCHCGVNDISSARSLEDVLADMDAVKALVDAQAQPCTMAVAEILPWTNGTDEQAATVRAWNSAYAAWCSANNVPLVRTHDPLGQARVSTGYLDDLLTAYDDDGVHLVPAGTAAMGAVAAARLRSIP